MKVVVFLLAQHAASDITALPTPSAVQAIATHPPEHNVAKVTPITLPHMHVTIPIACPLARCAGLMATGALRGTNALS